MTKHRRQSTKAPVEAYREIMAQVKERIEVVRILLVPGERPLPLRQAIQSSALQLRMTMENIALASLVANQDVYLAQRAQFVKDWNAGDMIERLHKIHPRFYPRPVSGTRRDAATGLLSMIPVTSGYVTESEFPRLYGRLGALCHAPQPFREVPDYQGQINELLGVRAKLMRLLNDHEVYLIGEDEFWLVSMVLPDDSSKVRSTRFVKAGRIEDLVATGAIQLPERPGGP